MDEHHDIHPYQAMGDPVRRRIVDILASGEHTSGQVADVIGYEFRISRTAVSKHLRILRDAGLVDVRAELQWRWYRLIPDGMRDLERELLDLRIKVDSAVGWDADRRQLHDPIGPGARFPDYSPLPGRGRPVPRKGPGRAPRAGTRGRQREPFRAADPDVPYPILMPAHSPFGRLFPPTTDESMMDELTTDESTTDEPMTDESTTDASATDAASAAANVADSSTGHDGGS